MAHFFTMMRIAFEVVRLRRHERWSRADILAHQAREFEKLRRYVYQNSPFYRQFHAGLFDAPLSELPVLTKKMVMENFDSVVTDRRLQLNRIHELLARPQYGRIENCEVVTTSGTTGMPGVFVFNAGEWARIAAAFARAREWSGGGVQFGKTKRLAIVASTDEHFVTARISRLAKIPFMPVLHLDVTSSIPELVEKLNAWQPQILSVYAGTGYQLALQQTAGKLNIRPQQVLTGSEVLTQNMREVIQRVWGNNIFDTYGSTEAAVIAAETKGHNGLQVFEDMVIVENVDSLNRPVADGAYGEKLLVTPLFHRTLPLIRYELSDRVMFAAAQGGNANGFRRIVAIAGRQEDTLHFGPHAVHPNVFHSLMDLVSCTGWQIVQTAQGLTVLIVGGVQSDTLADRVREALRRQQIAEEYLPDVTIRHVQEIPKSRSGKTPLIKALSIQPR